MRVDSSSILQIIPKKLNNFRDEDHKNPNPDKGVCKKAKDENNGIKKYFSKARKMIPTVPVK